MMNRKSDKKKRKREKEKAVQNKSKENGLCRKSTLKKGIKKACVRKPGSPTE